jgi:hypothetical protein
MTTGPATTDRVHEPQLPHTGARQTDGRAVASMVVGIVSLALGWLLLPLLGGPVALALGWGSMKRIEASGGALGGRGTAVAGLVLGIIATVLLVPAALMFLPAGDVVTAP